jgi:type IV pilus assembly protein PilC
MKLRELAEFCRRMGIGLRAGVDVLKLLHNEQRMGSVHHRQAMADVESKIRSGETLADSMRAQGKYFPHLLIQMIHASEIGGRTEAVFAYMASYYEQLKKTRSDFVQRISWPIIQLILAIGIVGAVILIQGILSPNSTYDASSFNLRGVGGFVIYCTVVLSVFSVLAVIGYGLWKNWFNCHRTLMPIVQRIPKLGTALVTLGLSRLSMSLSMLLNAGVDAKYAVEQAFLATGNHYFIGGKDRAVAEVAQGGSFGDAFEKSNVLPQEFIDTVRVGELSGTETESLDHLAEEYQQRASSALSTLAMIASMVVWLSIMIFIGFIVLRMAFKYLKLINNAVNNPMGDW